MNFNNSRNSKSFDDNEEIKSGFDTTITRCSIFETLTDYQINVIEKSLSYTIPEIFDLKTIFDLWSKSISSKSSIKSVISNNRSLLSTDVKWKWKIISITCYKSRWFVNYSLINK